MPADHFFLVLVLAALAAPAHSFYSYANDFFDPSYILAHNFSNTTLLAQQTILQWADQTAALGPWSVTNKSVVPPSGSKHDYMSWAPYWWPDCSDAGNTTELTPEQIWTTCRYFNRDGKFNPDVRTSGLNDIGNFGDMSDAILYNSLAWAIANETSRSRYAANVARWINVWFVDPETRMNPHLGFGQMRRGRDGRNGTHTGILDLKSMAKVVSGVLILREGKALEWTSSGADTGFVDWAKSYLSWLTTAKLAIQERGAKNNHGTFYFNQLAALQILVRDLDGARATIQDYFAGIYMNQIAADGDQPLESLRTRPYHYRAYNLAAIITNARLGAYVNYTAWNLTTSMGGTIQAACRYAMSKPAGNENPSELWSIVNAIGATFGDSTMLALAPTGVTPNSSHPGPSGKGLYAGFLLANAGERYPQDASFLWNQPFSDSGIVKEMLASGSSKGNDNPGSTDHVLPLTTKTKGKGEEKGKGESAEIAWLLGEHVTSWMVSYAGFSLLALVSLLEFL